MNVQEKEQLHIIRISNAQRKITVVSNDSNEFTSPSPGLRCGARRHEGVEGVKPS